MFNFKELLAKKAKTTTKTEEDKGILSTNGDKVVQHLSNWYSDRYNNVVLQRNLLLVLLLASIVIVIVSTVIVGDVTSTFKIQPFVIEVEDKTGITNIVNPLADRELTTNEVLNRYFLMRYVKARESYNFQTWKYNYLTVVRLLSDPGVYGSFRRYIMSSPDSPLAKYGSQISTYVAFRSIQFFPPSNDEAGVPNDSKAIIRVTIFPENGNVKGTTGNRVHKIITLTYKYAQSEMNDNERSENPLGFYITSYRADIENDAPPEIVQ